jgi:hypothetical protein
MLHNTRHRPLPRKPHPKITRPGKRRRVTLIAAFRCDAGGHPAIVLCADTQETVGDTRVAVNKLLPQDVGDYLLAIAGSGNGNLIDGFTDSLVRLVKTWPAGANEQFARDSIRDLLVDFYDNEVRLYPADQPSDNINDFLVCIKPKGTKDVFLWEIHGPTIVPVGNHALLGITAAIYTHELCKLYRPQLSMSQAILLGIHLFSLAKATSNYVGGETDIVLVRNTSMWPFAREETHILEQRISALNQKIAELVIALPDSAVHGDELKALLLHFQDWVLDFRERDVKRTQHITLQVHDSMHAHWADNVTLSVDDSKKP